MESKVIVFVVFAILAQSSFVLRSDAYKLSKNTTAKMAQISLDQKAASNGTFKSFNILFDVLKELAAERIWNLKAETNNYTSQVAQANASAEDAINSSSNAILLVVGQYCSDFQKSGRSRDFNLNNVFSLIPMTVKLVTNKNFSKNGARIANLRVPVEKKLANSIHGLYNAIRSCLKTKDKKVLAAIKVAEAGSREAVIHTVRAVFNAVEILYAATIHAGSKNLAVITDIVEEERNALTSLGASIEHSFGLYSALVINSDLRLRGATFDLNSIEYARTVSANKWTKGLDVFYEIFLAFLRKISLGISYAGNNDFSRIDEGRAESAAEFMAGFQAFSDSTVIVNPNATNAVADASASFVNGSTELAAIYYGALNVALSEDITYNEANKTIEMLKNKSSIGIPVLGSKVFELILIGDPKAVSSSNQTALVTAIICYGKRNLHAIGNLLKITHGRKDISEDDFAAVRTLQKEAVPLIASATRIIADARIDVLIDKLSG